MKVVLYFAKVCLISASSAVLIACGSGATGPGDSPRDTPTIDGGSQNMESTPVDNTVVDIQNFSSEQSLSSSSSSVFIESSSSEVSQQNSSLSTQSSSSTTSSIVVSTPLSSSSAITSSSSSVSTTVSSSSAVSSSSSSVSNLTQIQGTITYDRVYFDGRSYKGLDYGSIARLPARSVRVQLVNSNSEVIASDITDDNGQYQFSASKNTMAYVRVLAQSEGANTAQWDIQVRDNTNSNALYAMEGSLANTGTGQGQMRDLHASSGWGGSEYTGPRSAGPFAVLDSIYDAITLVSSADPNIVLPPLDVYWSPQNIAIGGNLSDGYIGTSFYTSAGPSIYLLGAQNNDSDEYDRAVVQHEFGHYLEHQLARTESIGGSHSIYSTLDMRVAFGEAWGNAFAGMASGDPIYRDSLGSQQSLGFAIDVETTSFGKQGWFSEGSIQNILYDLFDSNADQNDNVNLGFNAIYNTLTSDAYLNFEGFASIFSFVAALKEQNPSASTSVDSLVEAFNIQGQGWFGEGETNDGGSAHVLPVYRELSPGNTINVCSDSDFQEYNGVDTRRMIKLDIDSNDTYTVSATLSGGGLARTNPQIRLFQQGREINGSYRSSRDNETLEHFLNRGTYIIEIYEETNVDSNDTTGGLACFDVSVN